MSFKDMTPEQRRAAGAKGGRKSKGGGFASMDSTRLKEVSRRGGLARHKRKVEDLIDESTH